MNKYLEPTLSGLIPSLVGPVPTELIELTAALITQSRNRISNLKPQEESNRVYVCAHIACDRLRKKLDLPTIEPHPHLEKKAYGALYNQFHKALTTFSSRNRQSTQQARALPSTAASAAATSTAAPTQDVSSSSTADPSTVDPAIRTHVITLCQALSAPAAAKHIIAGTVATLKLATDDKLPHKNNYALPVITAVTLLIIEKLLPEGRITTLGTAGKWRRGEGYCTKRDAVMKALGNVGKDGFTKEETDGWVKDLSVMGIRELEWLKDVPDQGGIKKRKADVTEKYDRQLQEEIMAVKAVNKPARKRPAPKNTPTATPTTGKKKEEVPFAAPPLAPMAPVAPVAPMAPVAPIAPIAHVSHVAPVAPVAPAAPVAPVASVAPIAPMAFVTPVAPVGLVATMATRTLKSRTNTELRTREKEESGIGTMMQDRVDYLNAKRRKLYASWQDGILERCNEVEKELQGQSQAVRV